MPGRAVNALRLTAMALIVVAICEVFRIPSAATAAYITFIVVKADADAAIPAALLCGVAIVFGILASIVYFAATLSEPALRLPLMAAIAFGAVYLSRASSLGLAAFISGLFMVIALTQGDDLTTGALSPYNDANAEGPALPDLAYMSPEEALVHNLLWMALAIATAAATILGVSRLTLPDPERKLRDAVATRLDVMAEVCAGRADARQRLTAFARQGTAALKAQNMLAGKLKHGRYRPAFGTGVIDAASRLTLVLLATGRLPDRAATSPALAAAAQSLSAAARALRTGEAMPPAATAVAPPAQASGTEVLLRIEDELQRCVADLRLAMNGGNGADGAATGVGLFKPDAFSNPAYVRFAAKVTLALMASYLFMELSDWSQISTCMTTCYVLAASGVGQSVHKAMLRISGALAGAALGFLAILFVMPALTDLGQLLCVMAPVLLAAAWIRVGGERTNYFGQQMAFAFMLMVVQDYGPTLDFQAGRNRLVGILVGEVVFTLVFLHIWPVSVGSLVRAATSGALRRLAEALSPGEPRSRARAIQAFTDQVEAARTLVVDERYEPDIIRRYGTGPAITANALLGLQSLAVPASIIIREEHGRETGAPCPCGADLSPLAAWLGAFAAWIEAGGDLGDLVASRPRAALLVDGAQDAATTAWCRTLDADLGAALVGLGLEPGTHPTGAGPEQA